MKRGTDVIIVGGGAIGLTAAWELAGQGLSVRLLDRGRCGREASWAGAGMILPGNPASASTPEARLRAASFDQWPQLSAALLEETGVDNEFRACGGIEVGFEGQQFRLDDEVARWQSEQITVLALTDSEVHQRESGLGHRVTAAYELPTMSQIRNPRHLRALQMACERRGVLIHEDAEVVGFGIDGDSITGVRTSEQRLTADKVCVCAGAWTKTLLQETRFDFDIQPVRGQMVMLRATPPRITRILQQGSRYVVPRSDGRALIGSTEEWVGFEKKNTAAAVAGLIDFAVTLVPDFADAAIERTWSGLRPGTPAGVPFIGQVPGLKNLFVAAGHFRNGLQNSPATGRLLREMMMDQETCLDPADFDGQSRERVVASS